MREASRKAELRADSTGADVFLPERAQALVSQSRERGVPGSLAVPSVPSWISWAGLLAAFAAAWWFAALGQDREINILSLPLITIIAWNVIVMMISLLHGINRHGTEAPRWLVALHDRFSARDDTASNWLAPLKARFREIAWPVALQRLGFRFRCWLHMAAALFAFGAIAAMYSRGWSHDYRAVWESTLLSEDGARRFFGALFALASAVSGVTIPLDELAAMHRIASAPAPGPGAALPWIHLYAWTLTIFVIAPRIVLAWLERRRSEAVVSLALRSIEWTQYAQRVRDDGETSGAPATFITYALVGDDAARDRWRKLARKRWRDLGPAECESVPVGRESEFAESWTPGTTRVLLIFNLSSTPETEVHRALVEKLIERAQSVKAAVSFAVTLDDADLKRRWSGLADGEERLKARTSSWHETFRGLHVEWI